MRFTTTLWLGASLALFTALPLAQAKPPARSAKVLHDYTMVPTSLEAFGYSAAELADAHAKGLAYTNLPSIGSGLENLGDGFYLGMTDRGASITVPERIFPLPQFTPALVLFHASGDQLVLDSTLPLVGHSGAGVTGIPNSATEDSAPFFAVGSPIPPFFAVGSPIPYNPSGIDPEDVHTLPNGQFILVEEYSPSIVIVSSTGEVLKRYTPASKTLPGADYPISNTLPDVFKNRRSNRGFESLAVSPDKRTAYTVTQSPMGSTSAGSKYRDSSIVRVVRMDVSDPLNMQITGQFALSMSPASDYPTGNAQRDLKISAAAWVRPDVLLLIELNDLVGVGGMRLLLVDLRQASNVHGLPVADTLDLEDVTKGPASFGLTSATSTIVHQQFETDAVKLLPSGKLEGLSILNANEVAISNDNDFGVGDVPGLISRLIVLRLADQLPLK